MCPPNESGQWLSTKLGTLEALLFQREGHGLLCERTVTCKELFLFEDPLLVSFDS